MHPTPHLPFDEAPTSLFRRESLGGTVLLATGAPAGGPDTTTVLPGMGGDRLAPHSAPAPHPRRRERPRLGLVPALVALATLTSAALVALIIVAFARPPARAPAPAPAPAATAPPPDTATALALERAHRVLVPLARLTAPTTLPSS